MFMLAGLLGMMVLGSVVMVTVDEPQDDSDTPHGDAPHIDQPHIDQSQDDPAATDSADRQGRAGGSLFAEMGLINAFDAPGAGSGDEDSAMPDAGPDAAPEPDRFLLDDWITQTPAQLLEYDADEDQLIVLYDDSDGAEAPEIALRPSPDDPGLTDLLLDGEVVSTMPTAEAPALDSIVLLGESLAGDMAGDVAADGSPA